MNQLDPSFLLPGAWRLTSQAALDRLARCGTLDDVEREFRTARDLAESTLGFPLNGGHATKSVIRALGRLLHHPLGPSLACEVLTVAVTVSDLVDSNTVEALLDQAVGARSSSRAPRAEERQAVHDGLSTVAPSSRRGTLLDWWSRTRSEEWAYHECEWRPDWWASVVVEHLMPLHEEEGLALLAHVGDGIMRHVADQDALFELDEAVVAAVVRAHPDRVVRNWSCPEVIRQRMLRPQNLPTAELALRSGLLTPPDRTLPRSVDDALRAFFGGLDDGELDGLATVAPTALATLMERLGLPAAERLGAGQRETDVDWGTATSGVSHPRQEATSSEQTRREAERYVDHVFKHHADVEVVLSLLESLPTRFPSGELVATAPLIRRLAPRLDFEQRVRHVPFCPGLTSVERDVSWSSWRLLDAFHYGPVPSALDGEDLIGHPGWTISLPATPEALEDNARLMQNCTAGMIRAIRTGRVAVLIISTPDGTMYNAEITHSVGRWYVGQVNARANRSWEVPEWLPGSLTATVEAVEAAERHDLARVDGRERTLPHDDPRDDTIPVRFAGTNHAVRRERARERRRRAAKPGGGSGVTRRGSRRATRVRSRQVWSGRAPRS